MTLEFDGSQEEIELFLQESDELIQTLDEDIVRLEKEGSEVELLQEIFRAAHTLKGSSGMLGHSRMAKLTHTMESLFDKLRKGEMAVAVDLIDLLLEALDAIKLINNELVTKKESGVDVDSLVVKIEAFMGGGADPTKAKGNPKKDEPKKAKAEEEKPKTSIIATEEDEGAIAQAEIKGEKIFMVKVVLSGDCPMPAVRLFQVVEELRSLGEIIKSSPTDAELEEGKEIFEFNAIFGTEGDHDRIESALKLISEVIKIEVAAKETAEEEAEGSKDDAISAGEQAPKTGAALEVDSASSAGPPEEAAVPKTAPTKTVRVDIERLDNLMNLVGELVINKTRLLRIGYELQENYELGELSSDLNATTALVGQITNDLQEEIMKARMLPIDQIFNKLPRLVRDLARKAGKQVNFDMSGKDTELDRTVIEEIGDPLIHILRNAVDHGIEELKEREKAGKPAEGRVFLAARHEESHIVIEIKDDGRGIDADKLKNKAVEKGIIDRTEADRMDDKEAYKLIFLSGLSTAKTVTDISGRGVGMDVVMNNIKKINGRLDIESKLGKWTKFLIKIPLTLAIVDALLVLLGSRTYAIPLNSVKEVFRMDKSEVRFAAGEEKALLRGRVLPLVKLRQLFEGEDCEEEEELQVVVVGFGDINVGLIVDSLVSKQEIVIKSLGNFLGEMDGISGATILGDGMVALIVDVINLISRTDKKVKQATAG
ncbi:MAG: chemotaxis protein CheA [Actinomycetota bacterium]|nr:chemotaxis protein CheA [Actinomycetota bacterium]